MTMMKPIHTNVICRDGVNGMADMAVAIPLFCAMCSIYTNLDICSVCIGLSFIIRETITRCTPVTPLLFDLRCMRYYCRPMSASFQHRRFIPRSLFWYQKIKKNLSSNTGLWLLAIALLKRATALVILQHTEFTDIDFLISYNKNSQ